MKKILAVILATGLLVSLAGCADIGTADDAWVKDVHPASDSLYSVGENSTRFLNGYFDNITGSFVVADNASLTELWLPDNTSIHTLDGSTFAGGGTGTSDHAALSNLDYASSGHTGFQPALGFAPGTSNVTDHGQLTGLSDDDHTQYLLANGSRALTGNLNFAGYIAAAMVCDKGATVPATPAAGQWFLHTPTGRTVLLMYDGSSWQPIMSLGTFTVYVDATDGTDDMNHGTGVDANAFKTVQYAVNCIPGLVGGNVAININAETYAENVVIQGKSYIGDYSITLQGTLVAHATNAQESSVQGATTTLGSITDTGEFTGHAGDLLYSSNNNEYRVIDSVTANTGTIVGYWTAAPLGNYTIYQWGTTLSSLTITGQLKVYVNDIASNGTGFVATAGSTGSYTRCKSNLTTAAMCSIAGASDFTITDCYFANSTAIDTLALNTSSYATLIRVKVVNTNDGGFCLTASAQSNIVMVVAPSVIDGLAGAAKATFGVFSTSGSMINMAAVYHRVRNCDNGILAQYGGQVYYTANNQYSGNGANEAAVAASYGYID